MPWKELSVVEERVKFVLRREAGEAMSELCREFGISRQKGHKWYKRFTERGLDGVCDESRRPITSPNKTPLVVESLIVSAKQRRPTWGSKKLEKVLGKRHPGVKFPSRCTIDEILKRNGLVTPRRRRRLIPEYPEHLTESRAPNHVWCVDFKGQFRLGDGTLCYPLTITDHHSRFVIACVALDHPTADAVFEVFDRVFSRRGLPRVIRTDNGVPFATRTLGGLSTLSAWWVSLGIVCERIEPGHPEQNGRHERMHRTLKQETMRPPALNLEEQQKRFDAFVHDFNHERPHEALGLTVPAASYDPSTEAYPRRLDSIEYPLHDLTCRVSPSGMIKAKALTPGGIYLSRALCSHNVGLRELDDRRWLVTFSKMDLGHITADGTRFEPLERMVTVRDERAHLKTRPAKDGPSKEGRATGGPCGSHSTSQTARSQGGEAKPRASR